MEAKKSPWSDGLPAEFYKVFWKDIKRPLLNALNYTYLKVFYQLIKEEV